MSSVVIDVAILLFHSRTAQFKLISSALSTAVCIVLVCIVSNLLLNAVV